MNTYFLILVILLLSFLVLRKTRENFGNNSINQLHNKLKLKYGKFREGLSVKLTRANNYINKRICIITAVSGDYKANIESIDHIDVNGFVFGDGTNVVMHGTRWIRDDTCYYHHEDPFMRVKYYKTQWHKIRRLDNYDIVVWMDATLKLKTAPPIPNVDSIIAYRHQIRESTHAEIDVSTDARYQPYIQGLQMQRNDRIDVPWLSITCWIVNRRGPRVYAMNDAWFNDILKYSPQDQVSFPTACITTKVPIRLLNDGTSHIETTYYKKNKHLTKYHEYRPSRNGAT